MGFNGMSVKDFQTLLDTRFPEGAHVWVNMGGEVATFLTPRVFVLDHETVMFSPKEDMTYYFDPVIAEVELVSKKEMWLTTSTGKVFKFTPVTKTGAKQLKERVTEANTQGYVESLRVAKASEIR